MIRVWTILLKAQTDILETHNYAIFNWREYVFLSSLPACEQGSPKLVGSTP